MDFSVFLAIASQNEEAVAQARELIQGQYTNSEFPPFLLQSYRLY
jgi:hypothetical protein